MGAARYGKKTIPLDRESVIEYLTEAVNHWRNSDQDFARHYVDAYQSVAQALFGEVQWSEPYRHEDLDRFYEAASHCDLSQRDIPNWVALREALIELQGRFLAATLRGPINLQ